MCSNAPRWSSDVHQADWIAPRLAPWEDEYTITIVVPAGFEAYARVLYPVETAENGDRLVRWADVAAWSVRSGLRGDDQKLQREVHDYLTFALLGLTGM